MNPVFRILLQQARKLIKDPKKSKQVLDDALKKSDDLDGNKSYIQTIKQSVRLFFPMLWDFIRGRYRNIPLKTGVKMLGALLYFVFLADLIPDFLPLVGLTDDAAVLAWVLNSIGGDIEKYKQWKEEQNQSVEVNE